MNMDFGDVFNDKKDFRREMLLSGMQAGTDIASGLIAAAGAAKQRRLMQKLEEQRRRDEEERFKKTFGLQERGTNIAALDKLAAYRDQALQKNKRTRFNKDVLQALRNLRTRG